MLTTHYLFLVGPRKFPDVAEKFGSTCMLLLQCCLRRTAAGQALYPHARSVRGSTPEPK